jgi:hypothetical protein
VVQVENVVGIDSDEEILPSPRSRYRDCCRTGGCTVFLIPLLVGWYHSTEPRETFDTSSQPPVSYPCPSTCPRALEHTVRIDILIEYG